MTKYLILALILSSFSLPAYSRIRLRKVKDAPKTCALMKEDSLLSRPEKPVWSTERHSVVVADDISLVNDLGQTVCTWPRSLFNPLGDITNFRFYIDEFKEIVYPYVQNQQAGFLVIKTPFQSCSLDERTKISSLEFPKCEKPKARSRKKKKSNKTTA